MLENIHIEDYNAPLVLWWSLVLAAFRSLGGMDEDPCRITGITRAGMD